MVPPKVPVPQLISKGALRVVSEPDDAEAAELEDGVAEDAGAEALLGALLQLVKMDASKVAANMAAVVFFFIIFPFLPSNKNKI